MLRKNARITLRFLAFSLLIIFISSIIVIDLVRVKVSSASALGLPEPSKLVSISQAYSLPLLRGIKFDKDNPLKIEFILDSADMNFKNNNVMNQESQKLISYFLTALTVAKKDLWVNLSPYEHERIIPDCLEQTGMGKSMLAQDYILKQLSSSLTHPKTPTGDDYWSLANSGDETDNSIDFNKIWVVPGNTKVFENAQSAFITEARLNVMSETDYLAAKKNQQIKSSSANTQVLTSEIEKQVNSGHHFAELRQIYYSLILGTWFKQKFMHSLYYHYINQEKMSGIDIEDPSIKEKIWKLYCQSFEKGVYKLTNKSEGRVYSSGGLALDVIGFTTAPMENLEKQDVVASAIGELSVISSNIIAFDGENEIISSSVSNEEKIEQLLESSRGLIRTEDIAAIDSYLYNKTKKEKTNYAFVSLRSQQQLDALSKLIKVENGDYRLIDGPVYDVIKNGGVLLLDYDNSHPTLIEGFNSLFDKNPFYKDIENVSPQLKVLAAMKEQKKSHLDSNGFLDLDSTARSRFFVSDKVDLTYIDPLSLIETINTTSRIDSIDIQLDSAPDFENVLIGSADFTADGGVVFKQGKLVNAILENMSRLNNNQQVLPIAIKGDCWENTEFQNFLRQLIVKRKFYSNGELRKLPKEITFLKSYYDYSKGVENKEFKPSGTLANSNESYLINKKTQDILFGRRSITPTNKNAQLPGLLSQEKLKIIVSDKLDKWVWDRIMHSDCDIEIELVPGTVVPKVYRDLIPESIRSRASKENVKNFNDMKSEQSFLLGSDDTTLTRYQLIEEYGKENMVFYPITPFTDNTQLFETIKVTKQKNKYDFQLIIQQLINDLNDGKTIVLDNIDTNEELYDGLISMFLTKPYLILNGKRYNLDNFPGRIIGTSSKLMNNKQIFKYSEIKQNKQEIVKMISDFYPTVSEVDVNEVLELGQFFKENIPAPNITGLYPNDFSLDFSRIMLYFQHIEKSNDKLSAFEDIFISPYYWNKELRFYMRSMARLKFGTSESEQGSNTINGNKLFDTLADVLVKSDLKNTYWQIIDSLSIYQLSSLHEFGTSLPDYKQKDLEKIIGPALVKLAQNTGDKFDEITYRKRFAVHGNVSGSANIDMSLESFHEFDEDRMAHVRKVLDTFGAAFFKGSPGTGKSYIASEVAKEMGFAAENIIGPITTGSNTSENDVLGAIIKNKDNDSEFNEEAVAKWVPEMSYEEAQSREGRLLIVDEANLTNEKLWNVLNGFFAKSSSQRYVWVNGKRRYFNSNDRLIFTGNQETLEGRVYSDLVQKYMVTINFEDYNRDFYKKRLDEYLSNSKSNRDDLMELVLDVHDVYKDINESKVFSLRDIQEFARRLNKFTDKQWNTEDVLYQAWKQYYPQYEVEEAKALAEIFKQKYGVDLEVKYAKEIDKYIEDNYDFFLQKGIVLTKSSAELALAAENFLDVIDDRSLSQIQGKRAVFYQGASGRGKDLILEAVLDKKYQKAIRKVIRINVSGDVEEFTQAVKEAQKVGAILLAKEMNHLPSSYIEGELNDVLTGLAHPGFALFATMNTTDFGACEQFSTAMYNRSIFHIVEDYPQEELKTIYSVLNPDIPEDDMNHLLNIHCWIRDKVERLNKRPTTRDLRNALRLMKVDKISVEAAINFVYGDYYLNGLLKKTPRPEKIEMPKHDSEGIKKRVALFTKKDIDFSSNKIIGYERFYEGKFANLVKIIFDKRVLIAHGQKYPFAEIDLLSASEKKLLDALINSDEEYLKDTLATETFTILLSLRASGYLAEDELFKLKDILIKVYGVDLLVFIDKHLIKLKEKAFTLEENLDKQQKVKSDIVAMEAIIDVEADFKEILKNDSDEKSKNALNKITEKIKTFKAKAKKTDLAPKFETLYDDARARKDHMFSRIKSLIGNRGIDYKANSNTSGIFSSNRHLTIAGDHRDESKVYATSTASKYLLRDQYRKIDPVNQTRNFEKIVYSKYTLPTNLTATEFVDQYIIESDTSTQLTLPPDIIVVSITTEMDAGKLNIYNDAANQKWLLKTERTPGKITVGYIKRKDSYSDITPIEMFDEKTGKTLSRDEALKIIKNSIPSYVWDYLQQVKNSSYDEQVKAKDKIISMFYYANNPLLTKKAQEEGNFLKYSFKYMSLLCDGFAMLDATLSYVLDMPINIQNGSFSTVGKFKTHPGHAWTRDRYGLRDPTALAGEYSQLPSVTGVPTAAYKEEIRYIESSAKTRRRELRESLAPLEKTHELIDSMNSSELQAEEDSKQSIDDTKPDPQMAKLTKELSLEFDILLDELYKTSFVIDPETQKWDVTGKMDMHRFLQDPVRCCYRTSNSERLSAREVVLLGDLTDKDWNPILEQVILYMLNKGFTFRLDSTNVVGENSTDKLKDLAKIKSSMIQRNQNDNERINEFFDSNKGSNDHLFINLSELQKRFEHLYLYQAIKSPESEDELLIPELTETKEEMYEREKAVIEDVLDQLSLDNDLGNNFSKKNVLVEEDGMFSLYLNGRHIQNVTALRQLKDLKLISILDLSFIKSMQGIYELDLPNLKRLSLIDCDLDNIDFIKNFTSLQRLYLDNNKLLQNENVDFLKNSKVLNTLSLSNTAVDQKMQTEFSQILRDNPKSEKDIQRDTQLFTDVVFIDGVLSQVFRDNDIVARGNELSISKGKIAIDLSYRDLKDISALNELSNVDSIGTLHLNHNKHLETEGLLLPLSLKHLEMPGCNLRNGDFLDGLDNLNQLVLHNNNLIDGINYQHFKNLYYADLAGTSINNLKFLEGSPELEHLDVSDNKSIVYKNLKFIYNLKKITSVSLRNTSLSVTEIATLGQHTEVIRALQSYKGDYAEEKREVFKTEKEFIEATLRLLLINNGYSENFGVETFWVRDGKFGIDLSGLNLEDISALYSLKDEELLEYLDLSENPSMQGLDELNLPHLKKFNISECRINNIDFLKNFISLEKLELQLNSLDQSAVDVLKASKTLTDVNRFLSGLHGSAEVELREHLENNLKRKEVKEETDEDILEYEFSEVERVVQKVLADNGVSAGGGNVKVVDGKYHVQLKELGLKDVSALNELTDIANVESLDLSYNKNLNNLNELSLPHLKKLNLEACKLWNIEFIANFASLSEINLDSNNYLTGAHMSPLLNSRTLTAYSLDNVSITSNLLSTFDRIFENNKKKSQQTIPQETQEEIFAREKVELDAFFDRLYEDNILTEDQRRRVIRDYGTGRVSLQLGNCDLGDVSFLNKISHLSIIQDLDLSLNSKITGLSNLNFTQIEWLDLSDCNLTDASFLNNFPNLTTLDLARNKKIKGLHKLNLSKLTRLVLAHCNIKKANFLNAFENIEDLHLGFNPALDIRGLDLPNLKKLELSVSKITSIAVLNNHKKLENLNIRYNKSQKSLNGLNLPNLKELYAAGAGLKEIEFLRESKNLQRIQLNDNENLKNIDILKDSKTLLQCGLEDTAVPDQDKQQIETLIENNAKNKKMVDDENVVEESDVLDLKPIEEKVIDSIIDIDLALAKVKEMFLENGQETDYDKWLLVYKEQLSNDGFLDIVKNAIQPPVDHHSGKDISFRDFNVSSAIFAKGGIDFGGVVSGRRSEIISSAVIDVPFDLSRFKGFVFEISSIDSLDDVKAYLNEISV